MRWDCTISGCHPCFSHKWWLPNCCSENHSCWRMLLFTLILCRSHGWRQVGSLPKLVFIFLQNMIACFYPGIENQYLWAYLATFRYGLDGIPKEWMDKTTNAEKVLEDAINAFKDWKWAQILSQRHTGNRNTFLFYLFSCTYYQILYPYKSKNKETCNNK